MNLTFNNIIDYESNFSQIIHSPIYLIILIYLLIGDLGSLMTPRIGVNLN